MTSWDPDTAFAYVTQTGLETAFYSRYPNAYNSAHAGDWMAIWLNAQGVMPPPGPDGPPIDYVGAVAEENAISRAPGYVLPFTPVASSTPPVFRDATNFAHVILVDTAASSSTAVQTTAGVTAQPKKSILPVLIGAAIGAWLVLGS